MLHVAFLLIRLFPMTRFVFRMTPPFYTTSSDSIVTQAKVQRSARTRYDSVVGTKTIVTPTALSLTG